MLTIKLFEPNIDVRRAVPDGIIFSGYYQSSSPTEIQSVSNSGLFKITLHGNFTSSGALVTDYEMYRSGGTPLYSVSGLSEKYLGSFSTSTGGFGLTTVPNLANTVPGQPIRVVGSDGNDQVQPWSFNDLLFDGGNGTDTLKLRDTKSSHSIQREGDTITIKGPGGLGLIYKTTGVERIEFTDSAIAYDTAGNGGEAYRLYQAAFNRTPDKAGLGFQMKALDNGATLKQVAQNFLNSPEFQSAYGTNLADSQFVTQLYQNVLHRSPDASGLDFQIKALWSGTDRAQLLVNFSESPENQAALIGVIQDGMAYTI